MASRVDMHCHSTRLAALKARSSAFPGFARVRDAARGGLRAGQAAGDGLRHGHRPRHDRGCLELAGRPDCFVSEELTARFAGEPQAVNSSVTGSQHAGGDLHRDLRRDRDRRLRFSTTCAAPVLPSCGAPYVPGGCKRRTGTVDPAAVLKIAQRTISEGAAREGRVATDIGPGDARALLEAWLRSIELDLRGPDLLAYLQAEDFSHADLYLRARRTHERGLRSAVARGAPPPAGVTWPRPSATSSTP
jgi:hypothetical protein